MPWSLFSNIIPFDSDVITFRPEDGAGVEEIGVSLDDPQAEIYSLSGMRMTDSQNLAAGIYILRVGAKSKKIAIK